MGQIKEIKGKIVRPLGNSYLSYKVTDRKLFLKSCSSLPCYLKLLSKLPLIWHNILIVHGAISEASTFCVQKKSCIYHHFSTLVLNNNNNNKYQEIAISFELTQDCKLIFCSNSYSLVPEFCNLNGNTDRGTERVLHHNLTCFNPQSIKTILVWMTIWDLWQLVSVGRGWTMERRKMECSSITGSPSEPAR